MERAAFRVFLGTVMPAAIEDTSAALAPGRTEVQFPNPLEFDQHLRVRLKHWNQVRSRSISDNNGFEPPYYSGAETISTASRHEGNAAGPTVRVMIPLY